MDKETYEPLTGRSSAALKEDLQKATAPWVNENTYYWTYAGLARKSEAEIKTFNGAKTLSILGDK